MTRTALRLLLLAIPVLLVVACTRETTAPMPALKRDAALLGDGADSTKRDTSTFGGGSAGGGGAGRPY